MKKHYHNHPEKVIRRDLLNLQEEYLEFANAMDRLKNFYFDLEDIKRKLYSGEIVRTPYAEFYLPKNIENIQTFNLNHNL